MHVTIQNLCRKLVNSTSYSYQTLRNKLAIKLKIMTQNMTKKTKKMWGKIKTLDQFGLDSLPIIKC